MGSSAPRPIFCCCTLGSSILTPALQGRGEGPRQGPPHLQHERPKEPRKLLDLGVQLARRVGFGEPWDYLFSAAPHTRGASTSPLPMCCPPWCSTRSPPPGSARPPAAPAPRHMAPGAENRGPRCSGRPGPAAALARRVLAPMLTDP